MSTLGVPGLFSRTFVRGSELIGKPVITRSRGKAVENVEDIVFDRVSNQIVALVVDKGAGRILSWGGIHSITDEAVVATSEMMIVESEELLEVDRILEFGKDVVGMPLKSTGKRELGTVADIYFNTQTGTVIGFEITGGIFAETVSGRFLAPAAEIVRFGDDGVFVSPASARMFNGQVGGLKRSLRGIQDEWQALLESFETAMDITRKKARTRKASTQAREGLDDLNLGERLREAASHTQATVEDTAQQAGALLKQVLAERVVGQAKGHLAQHAVLTDNNELIVIAGQIVSDDVIAQARQHHKEIPLMSSVGLDFEDVLNANAHVLQRLVERYANEWRSEGKVVVDSLRDTAIGLDISKEYDGGT